MLLKTDRLTKRYGSTVALCDASISLESGNIYGVLGRNGSGKTTLSNIITNRIFATSGSCTLDGVSVVENDSIGSRIFSITEKSEYPPYLKVKQLFAWTQRFYPSFDMEYAISLSGRFDIDTTKNLRQLSTGYCTIAKVILTLASKVPLMLFDEPVLGIDSIYRRIFYTELQELHGRLGNTVVITTHILDELDGVVDHLIILKKGKVILDDKYGNIVKDGTTLADEYIRLHGVGTDD